MVQFKPKAQWSPPPFGKLKINVDAAYSDNLRQGGTGVGMRDHNGKLLKHKPYGMNLPLVPW